MMISRELEFFSISGVEDPRRRDLLVAQQLVEQYKQQYRELARTSFPGD